MNMNQDKDLRHIFDGHILTAQMECMIKILKYLDMLLDVYCYSKSMLRLLHCDKYKLYFLY